MMMKRFNMKLWFDQKNSENADLEDAYAKLQDCNFRLNFAQQSVHTLLDYLRELALDIKEIKSEAFKAGIGDLSQAFRLESDTRKVQSIFEKHKKKICNYIERQNEYLQARENELQDIIDLLGKALVTLDTENQEYNQKIYEKSEKIEQIIRLDDIKKIKHALAREIENIRETIQTKQDHDRKELEFLSKKVSVLDVELRRARAESMNDSLTGIHNRRAFDQHILALTGRKHKEPLSFALLMLDIDNFKRVNDTHGHQIGDRVLLALAQKCKRIIRDADFIARYGGEEFMIILPNTSLPDSVIKARSICESIASTRYSLEDEKPGNTLSITVSIGVSAYRNEDTSATIIERADQALYLAKQRGKNCVASEADLTCHDPLSIAAER
jgi:diguanylate cyclase